MPVAASTRTPANVRAIELAAHDRAVNAEFGEVVNDLIDRLGTPLVAIIGGVKDARRVRDWKAGKRDPRDPASEPTLRLALQIALMLTDGRSKRVAQAWFQGANPHLGYQAPAIVLRDGRLDDVRVPVVEAARSFIAG
jgi:hypothetical protein